MNLEISGKLIKVLPEQSGVGRNGNWLKQDFVIETEEQYPKKVCCTVWGDKAEELKKYKEGDNLKVGINIESREYNGKWYTDVKAWRIDGADTSSANNTRASYGDVPPPSSPPDFPIGSDNNFQGDTEEDDLPF